MAHSESEGSTPAAGAARCAIRARVTVDDRGAETTALTVHCPRQGRSLRLSVCGHCPRARAVVGHPTDLTLVCEPEDVVGLTHVPVRDAMLRDIVCVSEELAIAHAWCLLTSRRVDALPVVDPLGRPIGTVAEADLLRGVSPHAPVSFAMRREALTIYESAPLPVAAALMAQEAVHSVLVVDEHRVLVGVLTALGLAAWLARANGYVVAPSGRA